MVVEAHYLTQRSPQIIGVGTATQNQFYTQKELLELFSIKDQKIRAIFLNGGIKRRSLSLPHKNMLFETQGELLEKHKLCGIDMGARATLACLKTINADPEDIQHLSCVTSTGFLTPGLSALISKKLSLNHDCSRIDIVGMGCNAGLNGLNTTVNWAYRNPGKLAIILCVEVCSAAYVLDGSISNAVVNSLFGDGAAAAAVIYNPKKTAIQVMKFSSYLITEAIDTMKFNWSNQQNKFSFHLDPDIPYLIGRHSEAVITQLLYNTSIRRSNIQHWIIHSGGKKVINSIMINLGLTKHEVRHTLNILRNYGNISSASFLFSLQELITSKQTNVGDYGILMAMGPGTTIETALIKW